MAKKAKTTEEVAAFRQQVCQAATALFTERGPANVTMRQIAAAVGVSPMTPYRYFRDKDDILAAVRAAAYNQFAETLERAAAQTTDAATRARAVAEAYIHFARHSPDAYQLIFSFAQADEQRYPELVAANIRAQDTMVDYVRHLIEAGLLKGDARLIGYMFWASFHGVVVLEQANNLHGMNADALRDKLMATLYAGMLAAPPEPD